MFDSPLEWCPVRKLWAALDEERAECVRRNQCRVVNCPLARLFAEQPAQSRPRAMPPEHDPASRSGA